MSDQNNYTALRVVQPSGPVRTVGYTAPAGEANPTPVPVTCPNCSTQSSIMEPEQIDWSQHTDHLAAVLRQPDDVVTIKVECGSCGQAFFVEHPQQPAEEHLPANLMSERQAALAEQGITAVGHAETGTASEQRG